jgi:hypothetical protein
MQMTSIVAVVALVAAAVAAVMQKKHLYFQDSKDFCAMR